MSKRFDNKKSLYILAVLTVFLGLTILIKLPRERATIKEKLVELDTALVNRIIIYPRINEGASFEFARKNGTWILQNDNLTAVPERDAVRNMLMELQNIKPKSLEATDKVKWKDFNLTDSLAIRVKLLDNKEKSLADLMIGRFTYNQGRNPYENPYGNGIQGISYVRLARDKEVYGVEGFIALTFSGKFNDYRDKSFIKLNKENVVKISFTLPYDSSFVLTRQDSVWFAGNYPADSLAVAEYLNSLSYLNGQDFADNFKPANDPQCELSIEGNNLLSLSIKCYKTDNEDEYILSSSLNPDVFFTSRKDGLFEKLFKPERHFMTKTSTRKTQSKK
jgi:hypothetical protein